MKNKNEKWTEKMEDVFIAFMPAAGCLFLFMRISGLRIEKADKTLFALLLLLLTILFLLVFQHGNKKICREEGLE